jgi:hypothetical protein
MAFFRERGKGQELAPEVEPRQLQLNLLSFHHPGQNIVFVEDERGTIVLGVGAEQIRAVLGTFGETHSERIIFDVPLPW